MAPISFTPADIRVLEPKKTLNHLLDAQLSSTLLGSGNIGPDVMLRIFMSLRSGIDLEIKWALQTICQLLMSSPNLVDFEKLPFLGQELIKYFVRPFARQGEILADEKLENVSQELDFSLDSLLTLRNAAQDLSNQQWLSSVDGLKKNIVLALKQLLNWVLFGGVLDENGRPVATAVQKAHHNQFKEGFTYLLDLIEVLSCYYIEGTKADPLFHTLLTILTVLKDKHVLVASLRSLAHLLIVRPISRAVSHSEEEHSVSNCIESVLMGLLRQIVSFLVLDDVELVAASIDFLKAYLSLEAIHPDYPDSVEELQRFRCQELCRDHEIFLVLASQLPNLALAGLPLNDPSKMPTPAVVETLARRNPYGSMPLLVPELSQQLYDIVVRFPEPLRATTWLRCCYEPVVNPDVEGSNPGIEIPGEVTQISLWKAYEKQFDQVWSTKEGETVPPHSHFPKLLPAVDFIKNVSTAFPHSQAMVLNTPLAVPGEAPKRRFIIRGIQPRQFVVSVEVGNYDALRKQVSEKGAKSGIHSEYPVGSPDLEVFQQGLSAQTLQIEASSSFLSSNVLQTSNSTAIEISEYIIEEVLEKDSKLAAKFRNEVGWLKEVIYANPGLIEGGILSEKWLEYVTV